jgi:hypothetical protein
MMKSLLDIRRVQACQLLGVRKGIASSEKVAPMLADFQIADAQCFAGIPKRLDRSEIQKCPVA